MTLPASPSATCGWLQNSDLDHVVGRVACRSTGNHSMLPKMNPGALKMAVISERGSLTSLENQLTRLLCDIRDLRAGELPSSKDLMDAPIIEQWSLGLIPASCLVGSVCGHPILGNRARISTSHLVLIDPDHGWARTWSRYYRLGAPANPANSSEPS